MNDLAKSITLGAALVAGVLAPSVPAASPTATSAAHRQISQAAAEQKYTFILFYKQNDAATKAVAKTLSQEIAGRQDQAVALHVNITDPAEKSLVDKYKVARAPMPLTVAVAPNGAMTGMFQKTLEPKHIDESFVSPTMANCMKSLQEGKMVLLCVYPPGTKTLPAGVKEFQADPEFKNRVSPIAMRADDAAEGSLLGELEIDAETASDTTVVFMAPPGALVGKYSSDVTKATLAADLHAAGKCCDDPHCKHHKKAK